MKLKSPVIETEDCTIYFCSDLHYNHFNAIRHSSRPFETLEQMNKEIIKQLSILKPNDILFDLGDLFWNMTTDKCVEVLDKIPCKIYKIMGNHDKVNLWFGDSGKKLRNKVEGVYDSLDIRLVNKEGKEFMINLYHYPTGSWNHKSYGGVAIHGHCHGSWDKINNESKDLRIDVGWDASLSKEYGSFLIPWSVIYNHLLQKTRGLDFYRYVKQNINNINL